MATHKKEFSESVTDVVTSSLDNMKQFIDRTAVEVAKADVVGAGRRIADQVIDGTKDTVTKVAESVSKSDALAAVRNLATGTIENAKETVRVASEETQRINLMETGAKVTQEGLELLRRQVELGFDASSEMGEAANRMMPSFRGALPGNEKRPGVVTRVEIEPDGNVRTSKPSSGSSSSHK